MEASTVSSDAAFSMLPPNESLPVPVSQASVLYPSVTDNFV